MYFFIDETLLNFPPEAGPGFVDFIQVTTPAALCSKADRNLPPRFKTD
jgi:hypothetical protein